MLLGDLRSMVKIVTNMDTVYRANRRPTDEYYGICCKFARITELTIKAFYSLFLSMVTFVLLSGVLQSIIQTERLPLAHCYLPKVDEYSNDILYALVTLYNVGMLIVLVVTITPGDVFFFAIAVNVLMTPNIVQQQMDKLSAAGSMVVARHQLLRYMQTHQLYNE